MLIGNSNENTLYNGVALTTTGPSSPTGSGGFHDFVAYLNVTAVGGTSPSATIKLQDSPDGVTWYDVPAAAFTAATAVGTQRLAVSNLGPVVRAYATVTGTTPSVTVSLTLAGVN